MLRYGVFRLGEVWCVVGGEGAPRPFSDREEAVRAASGILKAHRASGQPAEVLAQDVSGWVTPLDAR